MIQEPLINTDQGTYQQAQGRASVNVLIGDQAYDILEDQNFRQAWENLYENCTWATVFQSYSYTASWYKTYKEQFVPVIVTYTLESKFLGILALTKYGDKLLTGAGADQAEYQVWICEPDVQDTFLKICLEAIFDRFPKYKIRIKYIPQYASIEWLRQHKSLKTRCVLRIKDRPLIVIKDSDFDVELRKKNRREKINRLKRLGSLSFERITQFKDFFSLFDTLALQYDFRKEAMFSKSFFRKDPCRKEFLLTLFRAGLLHVTIMKIDNEVIASNVGLTDKNWVHLQGMNTHSPMYARFSPGLLHFFMLGNCLSKEGVEVFDLTPGADTYKDSLATDYDKVYEIEVTSPVNKFISDLRMVSKKWLIQKAETQGVDLRSNAKLIKFRLAQLKHKLLHEIKDNLPPLRSNLECRKESESIFRQFISSSETAGQEKMKCCSMSDLLNFDEQVSDITRWEFLASSMKRLEIGEQCYTWCAGSKLLACVWQAGPKTDLGLKAPKGTFLHSAYLLSKTERSLDLFLREVAVRLEGDVYFVSNNPPSIKLIVKSE